MTSAKLTINLPAGADIFAVGPRWFCAADEEIEPPPSMAACVRLAAIIGTLSVALAFYHTLLTPLIQSKANLLFCFPIIVKWRALNEEEEIMKLTS